jgi:hypothetical protein
MPKTGKIYGLPEPVCCGRGVGWSRPCPTATSNEKAPSTIAPRLGSLRRAVHRSSPSAAPGAEGVIHGGSRETGSPVRSLAPELRLEVKAAADDASAIVSCGFRVLRVCFQSAFGARDKRSRTRICAPTGATNFYASGVPNCPARPPTRAADGSAADIKCLRMPRPAPTRIDSRGTKNQRRRRGMGST